jgi:xanthine/CO dehydrogenase XdhC/CoxF family maturation factor
MDKQRLMACYDDALDEQRREMRAKIDKELQSELPFKEDDDFTGKIEDDMTREEVLEKIEEGINYMEDIQNVSMELIDEQDSDLAQDCGGIIITDVNNMLANLEAVLLRHNESRLANRIKKIRETKSMADGTL